MIAVGSGHTLYSLLFEDHTRYHKQPAGTLCLESCPLSGWISCAVAEYYRSGVWNSPITLRPVGTSFQRSVWHALENIPLGETRSYAEIAQIIGKPTAARAVAGACRRNPYTLIVPCHRIVGSDGQLTGYAGSLWRKEWLLRFERSAQSRRSL
jgi:methylated-DNA-[protein]-cysteine S-methyltransferase